MEFDGLAVGTDRCDPTSHSLQVRLALKFCIGVEQIVSLIDLVATEILDLFPETTTQSRWINPKGWVGRVLLQIEAANETDRIVRYEPARRRIVVPMPVVVQA